MKSTIRVLNIQFSPFLVTVKVVSSPFHPFSSLRGRPNFCFPRFHGKLFIHFVFQKKRPCLNNIFFIQAHYSSLACIPCSRWQRLINICVNHAMCSHLHSGGLIFLIDIMRIIRFCVHSGLCKLVLSNMPKFGVLDNATLDLHWALCMLA